MSFLSSLTPKNLILQAIATKLKPFGITKVMLLFSCETNQYNIAVSNPDGKAMKIEITEDEITTIKTIFIKRIISEWKNKYDIEPKDVICTINLKDDSITLEIFIQDFKEVVHKFDY